MSSRNIGILLMALLLSACSMAPERSDPYTLPQYAEPDSRCRDLAGSFSAARHPMGEQKPDTKPLLALTLLPMQPNLDQAERVELAPGADGSFQVMALGADGRLLAKQRYATGSGVFECDDGQLKFHPHKLGDAKPAGISWETVVLRRTEDGSLMLRKGGLFSGLTFLVFPMYVSTDDWYLFKPAP